MLDDLEQKIKEKLLEDLISKMSDGNGARMKPKGLGVSVEAPNKAGLKDGLDKAKNILSKASMPLGADSKDSDLMSADSDNLHEDDDQRLLELLDDDDEGR